MTYTNPAPADYDAYAARERERLCDLCASYENLGTAILPRLTPEEYADLPMPGSDETCSHCGTRRVQMVAKSKDKLMRPPKPRRRRRTRDELDAARGLTAFVEESKREHEAAITDEAKGGETHEES